VKSELRTSLR